VTVMRVLGVAAILAAMVIYASTSSSGTVTVPPSENDGTWFLKALCVMMILGTAQSVISLPSHLPGLADSIRLRVPCFYLGYGLVFFAAWARRPVRSQPRVFGFAAFCGVTAVASTLLLFEGLDRMAQAQMVSIGFPTAIGASILFYAIYSAAILREPFSLRHAFGMAANLGGLIALAATK
jgi:uncharacterized membrane protein